MYKILAAHRIDKKISRIDKRYGRALAEAVKLISQNPLIGKPLSGDFKGQYSFRVGPYRLIYTFDPKAQIVFLANVDHRKDVYR